MQSNLGSPARPATTSASSMSGAAMQQAQQAAEDTLFTHLAEELTFTEDRKTETEKALMEDLMASLRKQEKLLDADAWQHAAPRTQLHLTSLSGVMTLKDQPRLPENRDNRANEPFIR